MALGDDIRAHIASQKKVADKRGDDLLLARAEAVLRANTLLIQWDFDARCQKLAAASGNGNPPVDDYIRDGVGWRTYRLSAHVPEGYKNDARYTYTANVRLTLNVTPNRDYVEIKGKDLIRLEKNEFLNDGLLESVFLAVYKNPDVSGYDNYAD